MEVGIEKGPAGQSRRPGDCLVEGLCVDDPTAVDFAGVHPLQPSCNLAEVQPGKAAARVEDMKRRESVALCKREGWGFGTFVVETFGPFSSGARFLCQRLVRVWALKHELPLPEASRVIHRALGCAWIRAVARQLERGFPSGDDVPVTSPAPLMAL